MFKVLKTIQFGEVDRNYEVPITHFCALSMILQGSLC